MSRRFQPHRSLHLLILAGLALFLLVACGGQAAPQPTVSAGGEEPAQEATRVVTETVVEEGEGQTAVAPPPSATAVSPTQAPPLATAEALEEIAEVEWPDRMRLGESDVVRLSLLPTDDGYEVRAEFAEHRTVTETVTLEQLAGYDVIAVARLDGVGFNLAPAGEQRQDWRAGRALTWRWTISPRRSGQQRLSLSLTMQWRPEPGRSLPSRQVTAFSRALDVQVVDGLALNGGQMLIMGLAILAVGLVIAMPVLRRLRREDAPLRRVRPDASLQLEPHPSLSLSDAEQALLKAVFRGYGRAAVEGEFRSGYSGARTLLVMPIRADGRADAFTIAKLGARQAIEREYENYVTYVEHTLPPVTARIQGRPVIVEERGTLRGANGASPLAALRYTFIGAPGQQPRSLRQALLDGGGPLLLEKLFRTFGPNWWMQRRPYTFRLALEYDCKLPVHAHVAPQGSAAAADVGVSGGGEATLLEGSRPPASVSLAVGDGVTLRGFKVAGHRQDGDAASLVGQGRDGAPPLRLRWLGPPPSDGARGRVVATRQTLLQQWTAGIERHGLPDPLQVLPALLARTIGGSRSIIHGDLNTENALVGPGEIVWLIDFASTREGHTLFDFAHLGAQLVAHVLPHRYAGSEDYLRALAAGEEPLLDKLQDIAARCLADAQQTDEFRLPLLVSCLGALKHDNLDARAREFLYLTGAYLVGERRETGD